MIDFNNDVSFIMIWVGFSIFLVWKGNQMKNHGKSKLTFAEELAIRLVRDKTEKDKLREKLVYQSDKSNRGFRLIIIGLFQLFLLLILMVISLWLN